MFTLYNHYMLTFEHLYPVFSIRLSSRLWARRPPARARWIAGIAGAWARGILPLRSQRQSLFVTLWWKERARARERERANSISICDTICGGPQPPSLSRARERGVSMSNSSPVGRGTVWLQRGMAWLQRSVATLHALLGQQVSAWDGPVSAWDGSVLLIQ